MLPNQSKTAIAPETAAAIIHQLVSFDDPQSIEEHLTEMLHVFLLYQHELTQEYKHEIYGSYSVLRDLLRATKQAQ